MIYNEKGGVQIQFIVMETYAPTLWKGTTSIKHCTKPRQRDT